MYEDDDKLVPCEYKPGFFKVPDKEASVSRAGELYLYATGKVYRATDYKFLVRENKGYAYAGMYSIHICVAETFIRIPEGKSREELIVNHKDGVKTNNVYTNLEWVTFSGNIIHAYETGLRTDNVRLKARNIETGEVIDFRSIGQCAQFFKVNNNRVFGYLNRKIREAAFLDTHLLVRADEEFPTEEESKGWKVSDNRASVIVFDPITKRAIIFQTMVRASLHLGLSTGTVGKAIRHARKNNTYIANVNGSVIIPIEYGRDYMQYVQEDRRTSEWIRDFEPPKRNKPKVKMTELTSGSVTEFDNIYEMAKHFRLRHETIMKKRAANDGVYDNYRIELI